MSASFIYNTDINSLATKAVSLLFNFVSSHCNEKQLVIGVSGGRSIIPILEKLIEKRDELVIESWRRLEFFLIDERIVEPDSEHCNFLPVGKFFQQLVYGGFLSNQQLHPFRCNLANPEEGIRSYQRELELLGGRFEAIILGVGEDGHIAALFPNRFLVSDTESKFIIINNAPKPPPERMSCSANLITAANFAIALFFGEAKRNALKSYFEDTTDVVDCPAKLVNAVSQSYVLSDIKP
ncbi:MAG: 6-phosphogluconolactonase [Deltaproteobacteria bacterium]|nr:6-phosphogluconolactonase [Deltaproteobacteria bacterium]